MEVVFYMADVPEIECPFCGSDIQQSEIYCPECGTDLVEDDNPTY